MAEKIIVALVVSAAAIGVLLGLRKKLSAKGGCGGCDCGSKNSDTPCPK